MSLGLQNLKNMNDKKYFFPVAAAIGKNGNFQFIWVAPSIARILNYHEQVFLWLVLVFSSALGRNYLDIKPAENWRLFWMYNV